MEKRKEPFLQQIIELLGVDNCSDLFAICSPELKAKLNSLNIESMNSLIKHNFIFFHQCLTCEELAELINLLCYY